MFVCKPFLSNPTHLHLSLKSKTSVFLQISVYYNVQREIKHLDSGPETTAYCPLLDGMLKI